MYDVVVYLSSLPRIADRNRKVEVLRAFAAGAESQGARVLIQTELKVVDCRLAVILGWVGAKIRGPHIQLRQNVIDHQRKSGHHVMPIDASCFKFADPNSYFLRYSLDGVFYNTNNYANADSNQTKWHMIQQHLGLDLHPWRISGDHVLVCLQRDGGWSMKGTDMTQWTKETVYKLKSLTNRPIVIRPHPKYQMDLSELVSLPGVSQSAPGRTLQQDLAGAWASVFCNSSSSVASALAGIPVFADDDDCVAWNVANKNLSQIESPIMPDRTQWLYDLGAAHWTDEESRSGAIYQHFSAYLK
jgi:hypothetical protein